MNHFLTKQKQCVHSNISFMWHVIYVDVNCAVSFFFISFTFQYKPQHNSQQGSSMINIKWMFNNNNHSLLMMRCKLCCISHVYCNIYFFFPFFLSFPYFQRNSFIIPRCCFFLCLASFSRFFIMPSLCSVVAYKWIPFFFNVVKSFHRKLQKMNYEYWDGKHL